ncbi:type II toxin-antitoxin system RelE/ParE family toxin [Tautonia plasticadhaerens]|uniref:Plasmid stabilization system protein n=1 Tax=Tautonia plasticadhaerens TaxID=2527974 RepID=A0A518HCF2_9BACT|nr:type II toxin-antitoxin system RelE/ParE family toxin [Tautonia plasticadhaerens]QDV38545.1 Plasmid stabilization system protein [Tautonia plasticadhaerens]
MDDLRLHPEAQAEYQASLIWYRGRSPQAANRFEVEFERALGMIAKSAAMFPLYDDQHRFVMLRRFPYGVVYRVLPDRIVVVAVAHSHRAPGYWKGRV